MARKTYSEHEREQVREALLTTALQCIVDRGLIHSSIDCAERSASPRASSTPSLPRKKNWCWRRFATSSPSCCNTPGS